jgi:SAM-dependent methyltransferase
MFARFRQRSYELENLDRGTYTREEYEGCLVELRRINRWLGDARALRRSFLPVVRREGLREFSALDVGAGSGELLRVAALWARGEGRGARLVGLELNERSAQSILEESEEFAEISAVRGDALRLPFATDAFDYCICSLFAHHFRDEGVVSVISEMARVARRGIFVIDLHRHPFAYLFFKTAARLFLRNRLIREDGALSILRAFKADELRRLAERARLEEVKIERRFPYRLVLTGRKAVITGK